VPIEATVLLKLIVTLLTLQALVPVLEAGENSRFDSHTDSIWKKAWLASVVFHGAGSAFDAFTSYHRGPYETNPILAARGVTPDNSAAAIRESMVPGNPGSALRRAGNASECR
jgi:hypothetical protein